MKFCEENLFGENFNYMLLILLALTSSTCFSHFINNFKKITLLCIKWISAQINVLLTESLAQLDFLKKYMVLAALIWKFSRTFFKNLKKILVRKVKERHLKSHTNSRKGSFLSCSYQNQENKCCQYLLNINKTLLIFK